MKRAFKDTHIYFPPKLSEAIKKLAKANRRSVSAEVIMAVEAHLKIARVNSK